MSFQLPIHSVQDAQVIGQAIAQSGMFGVNNDGAGTVIALMCYQRGITLDEFERTWQFIKGNRSMKYDVMLAKLLELGGDYEIVERTAERATIKVKGERHKDFQSFTLTMDEAKASGVALDKSGKLKDQYKTRPAVMLFSKVASDAIRVVEPRVNFGVYTDEEIEDFIPNENLAHGSAPVPKAVEFPSAAPAEQPAQSQAAPAPNYHICPIEPFRGKPWMELGATTEETVEILSQVLKNPRDLTQAHLDAVQAAIDALPF
jgi:hypothetical protein